MRPRLREMMLDEPELTSGNGDASRLSHNAVVDTADALVAKVRAAYISCYRSVTGSKSYGSQPLACWDGGEDRFGRRHQPAWPRLAAVLLELQADPIDYIAANFQGHVGRHPLTPVQLAGPAARQRWLARDATADNRRELLRMQLTAQANAVHGLAEAYVLGSRWSRERAMRYALGSASPVTLLPVLRYVLLLESRFADLAATVAEAALHDYLFRQHDYDAVLQDTIPQALKHDAGEIRQRLVDR